MRILNISAQKPDSTGSGVYLSEMVRCELLAGHAAAVVAGVDASDEPTLPEGAEPYFGAKSIGPTPQPVSTTQSYCRCFWSFWAIAYAVAFFVSAMHSRAKTSACRVIASVYIPCALH